MELMNITDSFLEAIANARSRPLSDKLRIQVKKCLLDYLGTALAGSVILDSQSKLYLDGFCTDRGEASVIGRSFRTGVCNAALLNGIHSHSTELDDGHRYCIMHPGAPVFSSLLPFAQTEHTDPDLFLLSAVTGYEAAVRLARSVQPGHKLKGYHATGTCAAAGAALAVACAMNLDNNQTKNALSAAVAGMSGLLELIEDSSNLKAYNAGKSAMNGIVSANLARSGFTGPNDVLGGKRGFFAVMSDDPDLVRVGSDIGEPYGIEGVYMKPYAACRYAHAPVQAALAIKERHGLRFEEIGSVLVETYDYAVPGHDHTNVAGTASAKMSIPYSVAVSLVTGDAGMDAFQAPRLDDSSILELTRKVKVIKNDELTALTPGIRAAIVRINTLKQSFCERVDYPYGEPENPLTHRDIEDKFISLASYWGGSRQYAESVIDMVWNLEERFTDLLEAL